MSRFMTCHWGLSNVVKRSLEANDIARIRPSKSIRLLKVQFGGPEKMECLPKDCINFINGRRRLQLDDGDARSIRKLFCKLQVIKSSFFYAIDLDWECRLRNMLWIHLRGRAAYVTSQGFLLSPGRVLTEVGKVRSRHFNFERN